MPQPADELFLSFDSCNDRTKRGRLAIAYYKCAVVRDCPVSETVYGHGTGGAKIELPGIRATFRTAPALSRLHDRLLSGVTLGSNGQ